MTTPLGGEFCSSSCVIAFLETQPDYKPEQLSYKKEEENGWYIGDQKITN